MSEKNINLSFRRRRMLQIFLLIAVVVVVLIGLLPLHRAGIRLQTQLKLTFITRDIGLAMAGGAAFIYLLFTLISWRCPGCKKFLWLRLFASKCKRCEVSFRKSKIDTVESDVEPVVETVAEPKPSQPKHSEPKPSSPEPRDDSKPEPQRRADDPGYQESEAQVEMARAGGLLVRCRCCPRCGSGSFRKKRPDKALPLFRVRECRNCNQRYKGPTSKKLCLVVVLIGVALMLPLLLKMNAYASVGLLFQNHWPLAIPAGLGLLIVLFGLKKMLWMKMVDPPSRDHGRRDGDIRKAYETSNLLLAAVSPNPVASFAPMEEPSSPKLSSPKPKSPTQPLPAQSLAAQPLSAKPSPVAATRPASTVTSDQTGALFSATKPDKPVRGTKQESAVNVVSGSKSTSESSSILTPVLNAEHTADSGSRRSLRAGCVIPAHPLALTANREFDERRTRALTRYYLDAGAGGVAIGVHTTQFALRQQPNELFRHVLEQTMGELFDHEMNHQKSLVKVAGICGETKQAIDEAELAAGLGYDAGLLNLAALNDATNERLLWHCREVAKAIPLFGFYLAPSVGGRHLDYDFWRQFAEIENVVAIKIAAFNRYDTINVVRAVAEAGRAIQPGSDNPQGIALYTGNDDHIVGDLLGEWTFDVNGEPVTQRIVGGLLGHWAVWTKAAIDTFESIRNVNTTGQLPMLSTALDRQVTDMNAAIFDAANGFKGCVPGVHEVLRRQGLLEGTWCLDPNEKLSPGQADEITRVIEAYPHLTDDPFVAEHRDKWLR